MTESKDDQPLLDEHTDHADMVLQKRDSDASDNEETAREVDVRFNPPPPSPWKRLALIILVCLLFYLGFHMRVALLADKKPKLIHASRYSKEHRFRPAASPIITETLKDGRTRLRGAQPTAAHTPTQTATVKKKRRRPGVGRTSGKARRKKSPAVAKQ